MDTTKNREFTKDKEHQVTQMASVDNDNIKQWERLFILERDLLEHQKSINRLDSSYKEILTKLEDIKDDLRNNNIDDFDPRLKAIEGMLDGIRQEMPEMRLTKKIVLGLVAFILTAFLGLIWNLAIQPPPSQTRGSIDEFFNRINEEYKKNEQH